MTSPSSGTLTFLFTDIEGSMRLWEEDPEAMATALSRHDGLLRKIISDSGGRVVKHTGDGFFAVFGEEGDTSSPMECALEIQHSVEDEEWNGLGPLALRIALNSGTAERRENDYFGPEVSRTSRILDACWGGQIVVTESTEASCRLPEGARLTDLGKHVLKDLAEPRRLYSLSHPLLRRREFPPLRSLDAHRHNLPLQHTEFIGRESELVQVKAYLEDPACRLLTLHGPGGAGKTRIALQAAADAIESYEDGVFFVPLAPVQRPEHLIQALSIALGQDHYSGDDPKKQILDYLADRDILLLMDNFEHLVAGASIISEIVEKCGKVKIMATSRQRLRLKSEWVFEVEGMGYDDSDGKNGDSALRLFEKSAGRLVPGFLLDSSNLESVKGICRNVGGLPLAIELAASWAPYLSPQDIARQIEEDISILESMLQDTPERHRSFRHVFRYSWKILPEKLRDILTGCSCFQSAFRPEYAKEVAGASLRDLAELVDRSLLHRTGEKRFQLHEITKKYSEEELAGDPGRYAVIGDRHRECFMRRLREIGQELHGEHQAEVLKKANLDIEDIRKAWETSISKGRFEDISETAGFIYRLFYSKGWLEDCLDLLNRALDSIDRDDIRKQELRVVSGRLLLFSGWLRILTGDYQEGTRDFMRSVAIFKAEEDHGNLSTAYRRLSSIELFKGNFQKARENLTVALDHARRSGEPQHIALAMNNLGNIQRRSGDYESARLSYEKALEVIENTDNLHIIAVCVGNLGIAHYRLGNFEKALELAEKGLEICVQMNDMRLIAEAHGDISNVLRAIGEVEEARTHCIKCLKLNREMGLKSAIAIALANLAAVESNCGRNDIALDHYREMGEIARQIGRPLLLTESLCGYADTLSDMGRHDESLEHYVRALEAAKGSPPVRAILDIFFSMARVLEVKGERDLALDLLAFVLGHAEVPEHLGKDVNEYIGGMIPRPSDDQMRIAGSRISGRDADGIIAELLGTFGDRKPPKGSGIP